MSDKKVCLVIGAGDATGGAIARRFAKEGYVACVVRRPRHIGKLQGLADSIIAEGNEAFAYGVDARDEQQMADLVEKIETEVGPIEVAVFNIGANVYFPIAETTTQVFTKVWEMACLSGFLMGREVSKRMTVREQGSIFFTGATASVRGSAGFSAFASAKHGLRALAQSMARELGPKNIHVAHLVVDGAINTEWTKENVPGFDKMLEQDNALQPGSIAQTYVDIHNQPRNAWTFELDIRPYGEKW